MERTAARDWNNPCRVAFRSSLTTVSRKDAAGWANRSTAEMYSDVDTHTSCRARCRGSAWYNRPAVCNLQQVNVGSLGRDREHKHRTDNNQDRHVHKGMNGDEWGWRMTKGAERTLVGRAWQVSRRALPC